MKSEENAQWQANPLNHRPSIKSKEAELNGAIFDFLNFEGKDDPHGYIANQQKCHNLTSRFARIMVIGVDSPSLCICYEQQLEHNLKFAKKGEYYIQQKLPVYKSSYS